MYEILHSFTMQTNIIAKEPKDAAFGALPGRERDYKRARGRRGAGK